MSRRVPRHQRRRASPLPAPGQVREPAEAAVAPQTPQMPQMPQTPQTPPTLPEPDAAAELFRRAVADAQVLAAPERLSWRP
ncbi:MAG: hypothetical protein KGJ64_13305, partial [Betaproteobacteria bacterium]|nr:hypothetical protein [Betaproteobacteria bacterium]